MQLTTSEFADERTLSLSMSSNCTSRRRRANVDAAAARRFNTGECCETVGDDDARIDLVLRMCVPGECDGGLYN